MVKFKNKISSSFLLKTLSIFIFCFFIAGIYNVMAQCPMCRAAAEQNLAGGGTSAIGLNRGILYLFLTPYLIVMSLGLVWYYRYRKVQKLEKR